MGNCCLSIFTMLLEKYGQEFITMCVLDKAVDFLKDMFVKVKAMLQTLLGELIKKIEAAINESEAKLMKLFND